MGKKKLVQLRDRIGFKTRSGEFHELGNFALYLDDYVLAPEEHPTMKGFMINVVQRTANTIQKGKCFLPWYDVHTSDQLVKIASTALPEGMLVCNLNSSQIKEYFAILLDQLDTDSDEDESAGIQQLGRRKLKPVVCGGRQPNSSTFIVGPTLQFTDGGCAIPLNEQEFAWIPSIIKRLKSNSIVHPLSNLPIMPTNQTAILAVVIGLQDITGDNFLSSLFMLGGAIISLMYDDIKASLGSVGVHVAYGEISKGKSNAVKVAISACCNLDKGYLTYMTESLSRQLLSNGLPFAYDDPTNAAVLKQVLINAFGGAGMGTQCSHGSARCAPLVTANTFVVDELSEAETRYIARTILVPFLFEPPALQVGRLEKILSLAPAAFPDLLKIGKKVVSECSALNSKLYSVRDKVESFFPNGLDSRLATQYALSILCCEMIGSHCEEIVSEEAILTYFQDVSVPVIKDRQVEENRDPEETLGGLIKAFGEAAVSKSEILTVINPNITYKLNALSKTNNSKVSGVGVSLKEFLLLLDQYSIDHEPESVLRLSLRRNKRSISRSKQFFLQSGSSSIAISRKSDDTKCKTCVCIPRDSLPLSFFELFNNNGETPSSTTCPSDNTQMNYSQLNHDNDDAYDYENSVIDISTKSSLSTENESLIKQKSKKRRFIRSSSLSPPHTYKRRVHCWSVEKYSPSKHYPPNPRRAKRKLTFTDKSDSVAKKATSSSADHSPDCVIKLAVTTQDQAPSKFLKKGKHPQIKKKETAPCRRSNRKGKSVAVTVQEDKCHKCQRVEGDDGDWVGCDNCTRWYHWRCIGFKKRPPKRKTFKCSLC